MASPDPDHPAPTLLRRLAAISYDSLLLYGVLFLAGLPLPLIPGDLRETWGVEFLVQSYLVFVCLLFFGWFWTHGGQTPGMRAWRLKVIGMHGSSVAWRPAVIRFFSAILSWAVLGLGFWLSLFDRDKLAWHDHLSRTRLILLPKPGKDPPAKSTSGRGE